jgi:hypothetical protein
METHKQSTLASFLWMNVLKALLIIMVVQTVENDPAQQPPGDMIFELYWPDGQDCDVDLHVKGPSGEVSYNNRATKFLNYVRDDLGNRGDATDRNFETVYSRGIDPGKYTVTAHLYSAACPTPVNVHLDVSARKSTGTAMQVLLSADSVLARSGDEQTMVNFELSKSASIVPGSQNTIPNNLAVKP